LVALTIQLAKLTKGKEKREQVWCTKCRTEGHHKDECPTFTQYLEVGASNPLPRGGYCEICKKWGHHPTECSLLHKYQSTPNNLFCNFCKFVGHEEKDCPVFDLLRERTSYMYRIQEENVAVEGGGLQYNNQRGFNQGNKGNFGRGRGRGIFGRGGQGSIICYNCNQTWTLGLPLPEYVYDVHILQSTGPLDKILSPTSCEVAGQRKPEP
jgi:hypothetical protein